MPLRAEGSEHYSPPSTKPATAVASCGYAAAWRLLGLLSSGNGLWSLRRCHQQDKQVAIQWNQVTSGTLQVGAIVAWRRWNNLGYLENVPNYQNESTRPKMVFNLKYNKQGETTWKHALETGNPAAELGVYEDAYAVDLAGGSKTWSVGALTPGTYNLRVEAYRTKDGSQDGYTGTHDAYHQVMVIKP